MAAMVDVLRSQSERRTKEGDYDGHGLVSRMTMGAVCVMSERTVSTVKYRRNGLAARS